MQFYTYVHRRQDDNLIFYVGKGQKRRAWSKKGRNKHWHNTVKKHGYVVEIWNYFLSEKDAFEDEMKLISNMPDCMKLTNLTLGGEGMSGYKYTEQQREKKRQISLGAKYRAISLSVANNSAVLSGHGPRNPCSRPLHHGNAFASNFHLPFTHFSTLCGLLFTRSRTRFLLAFS